MAMRNLWGKRRGFVAAMVCAAVGAGSMLVVQQAQASPAGTAPPTPPKIEANPGPTMHGTMPNGQAVPAVTATNAHCGQLVTASLTLNGNLYCNGNGLSVGGTSVVLNLNGFALYGPGYNSPGTGVMVLGKTDTVENGQISDFQYGTQVGGTSDTVTKLRLSFDFFGIDEYGTSNKITSDEAFANQGYGIVSFGTGATLTSNRAASDDASGGGYSGMYVGGTKSTASSNDVTGTLAGPGIYDGGYDTTLTANVADFNQQDGIVVYDSDVVDGGGNLAKGNDTTPAGSTPEQCLNIVCN